MEHIEIDFAPRCLNEHGYPPQAQPLLEWWNHMTQASSRLQRPIAYPEDTETLLTRAGFTDINHKVVRIPLQSHSQDRRHAELCRYYKGYMCDEDVDGNVMQGFEGLSLSLFTRQLQMPAQYVRNLCRVLRSICAHDQLPLYHNM